MEPTAAQTRGASEATKSDWKQKVFQQKEQMSLFIKGLEVNAKISDSEKLFEIISEIELVDDSQLAQVG